MGALPPPISKKISIVLKLSKIWGGIWIRSKHNTSRPQWRGDKINFRIKRLSISNLVRNYREGIKMLSLSG